MIKVVLLTLITFGIYSFYFTYTMAQDMNEIGLYDDEETPGLLMYLLLSIVTCGLYPVWWEYKMCNRMQKLAPRYGMNFTENGTTYIVWRIIGILLCGIGPFVALHIMTKNINALSKAYNQYGAR